MELNEKFFGGTQEIRMLILRFGEQMLYDKVSDITGLTAGLYGTEAKNGHDLVNKCN